jgi:DNA-binding NarL/FixJ family response regulator
MSDIRVVVVDDDDIFRMGLRAVLTDATGVEVVDEAATGDAALDVIAGCRPDVVLLDLRLPDMSGTDVCRKVGQMDDPPHVVIVSMHGDDESVVRALRAGACGYIVKGADQSAIVRAVHGAAAGEATFGAGVAALVRELLGREPTRPDKQFPALSRRELEVLELLASERSNADIARTLVISQKTVRNHVSTVIQKLHVLDRAAAGESARQAGLGPRSSA